MLELYTHPMSPCAQKVRIVLAEKGIDWTARHVSLPDKENLSAAYLKLNPAGVVPTLVDDGTPVIESSVICEYLDDKWPDVPLRPADPAKTAAMRVWMKHVDGKLHPSCGALQWPLSMADKISKLPPEEQDAILDRIPDEGRRERQRRALREGLDRPEFAKAVKVYRDTIRQMDKMLETRDWLVSDSFSLADACTAPYFQTLLQYGWQDMYEAYPRVAAWYARCRERASYAEAVAADFDADTLADLKRRGADAWERIRKIIAE